MNDLKQITSLFTAKLEQKIPESYRYRRNLPGKEVLEFEQKSAERLGAEYCAGSVSSPDTAWISSCLPHKTRADKGSFMLFSNSLTTAGLCYDINILNSYQGG